jgi:Zn-dependent protease
MQVFVMVVVGWLVSVCLHEFGHAVVAYIGGDEGVRRRGHLTNPLTYIQPVNSILMPMLYLAIGGLALPGAAVMVDERRIRSRIMRVLMSLAGPSMSALAGLAFAAPFVLGVWSPADPRPLVVAAGMLVQLQAMAVVLNLIPLPPLDGFQAVASLLFSHETKRSLMRGAAWAPTLLMIVMFYSRGAQQFVWDAAFRATTPIGLTPETFARAFDAFQFWR